MKFLGYFLLALPFIGVAVLGYCLEGFLLGVALPFGVAAAIVGLITGGITLIHGNQ